MNQIVNRRGILAVSAVAAAAVPLATCAGYVDAKDVGAVEDLMREHGILRRLLLIYRASAQRIRAAQTFDIAALNQACAIFRQFGEGYHEQKLEEAHIFPAVAKAGGEAASYIDVLKAQHARGRAINAYIDSATKLGKRDTRLADALDRFELMYEHHAAREDTIVFPGWKEALSASELDDLGDQFEDIEQQEVGKDGFEHIRTRVAAIERALGLSDIGQFTAPLP
ncbi:MAG: hemerythrin domain-containing protein [Alphaproteobacteria bacterium]|nr:hemerythrin domain-containing protein [Alphaproteobacteria bacterium]MBL6938752.1 hemerythrin domain-containing protein [Alphaproteobacteria bacterium]MBL7097891.1 hemerythrin domain-containing protein [Alphaproteobacteria bacterium]